MANPIPPDTDLRNRLRKRMLMFYFAAGINLVMAVWIFAVGSTQVASSTVWTVMLIFLAFAGLNFYMARVLQRQWDAHLRSLGYGRRDDATKQSDGSDAVTK